MMKTGIKRYLCVGIGTALALQLLGCAAKEDASPSRAGEKVETARGDVTDLMEEIEPGDISLQEESVSGRKEQAADFYVRLFQQSHKQGENTLLSPLSLWTALAMTANGAGGDTLSQMEKVFGMSLSEANSFLYTYVNQFSREDGGKLYLANSIWLKRDEHFLVEQDFLKQNACGYGADIYEAPFDSDTLAEINRWVSDSTEGRIQGILDEIDENGMMYLINALSFDGEWENIYWETAVRDGTFTGEDRTVKTVRMMYSEERQYLEDEQAEGFLKYYKGGRYAFAALLPREGVALSDYVHSLTGERLLEILSNPQDITVEAAIPAFESTFEAEMRDVLAAMGMKDAFDAELADFTGIGTYEGGNLLINRVLHKAYIKVDEKGTEAGAASAVEMAAGAALEPPVEKKQVYLDRPFLYMIIDCKTNLPVFMGTAAEIGE